MPKKTINEAIVEVLKIAGKPLGVQEIHNRIVEENLYHFNALDPVHIVRSQLRRHSDNLNFPTAHKSKHFVFQDDGKYWLKESKSKQTITNRKKEIKGDKTPSLFENIEHLHKNYTADFKQSILVQLLKLDPFSFEHFCKKLLQVYGFKNLKVTGKSKDGGIDGFGELKIGLAYMKVAFECKRWSKSSIGRPKVSQFRGDIQGKFQQGIFFTTSRFSNDAKEASFQAGAVPIILIDGQGIVDIMIEKEFGVEKNSLPIYTNALDLILQNDN